MGGWAHAIFDAAPMKNQTTGFLRPGAQNQAPGREPGFGMSGYAVATEDVLPSQYWPL